MSKVLQFGYKTQSLHFFQPVVQARHGRFAYTELHHAVHIVRLFQYLGRFFFYNSHHIVHKRILEYHANVLVYRLLYHGSFCYCLSRCCTIRYNQSAGAQLYTSEVSHHYNQYIGKLVRVYLTQDRLSGSARRLAVIVSPKILPSAPSI